MNKPVLNKEATSLRIKQKMEQMDISIREMSQALNTSYQAVWKYTHNKALPIPEHLYIMAWMLNCQIDDLLVGEV